jgi:DNA-binding transcriptional regulator YhcF (GntR family)
MTILIDNRSGQPIYEQIFEQLRAQIFSGAVAAEEALPSIRSLAKDLRISVITTKRAYQELESQGYIHTVPGKDCFVAGDNLDLLREERLRMVEASLAKAVSDARTAGITADELREMLELQPASDGTDIGAALKFLTNAIKKKCTAFLLSDMIDVDPAGNPRYEEALKVAVNRHDLSVIQVHDPRERSLPPVGLVHIKDSESGAGAWIDTDSRKVRAAYERWFSDLSTRQDALLNRYQIDHVDIATDEDYVKGLMALFNKR